MPPNAARLNSRQCHRTAPKNTNARPTRARPIERDKRPASGPKLFFAVSRPRHTRAPRPPMKKPRRSGVPIERDLERDLAALRFACRHIAPYPSQIRQCANVRFFHPEHARDRALILDVGQAPGAHVVAVAEEVFVDAGRPLR